MCEHHLLPFCGRAHIAYIPDRLVLGLSKFARITEMFAKRLQLQEKLTHEISQCLFSVLRPKGLAVVLEASHQCMSLRGVQKTVATTVTSSLHGQFKTCEADRNNLWALMQLPSINLPHTFRGNSSPARSFSGEGNTHNSTCDLRKVKIVDFSKIGSDEEGCGEEVEGEQENGCCGKHEKHEQEEERQGMFSVGKDHFLGLVSGKRGFALRPQQQLFSSFLLSLLSLCLCACLCVYVSTL